VPRMVGDGVRPTKPKERAIYDGSRTIMNMNPSTSSVPSGANSTRATFKAVRGQPKNAQSAQQNYERYLALARSQALIGDRIAAENYYQHAEHYFRSMSETLSTTG
jgi:hypothetical protein